MENTENRGIIVMGYDHVEQRQFLQTLENRFGNILMACAELGIGRTTIHNWRKRDDWFDQEVKRIIKESKHSMLDLARNSMVSNLLRGNVPMTIAYLKTHDPEWMDKPKVESQKREHELSAEAQDLLKQAIRYGLPAKFGSRMRAENSIDKK